MIQKKSTKKILSGFIAISVLLSLLPGIAAAQPVLRSVLQQGGNLLNNPGFEGPFVEHSATLHVAEGWLAWWVPTRSDQPEWQNQIPNFESTNHAQRVHGGSSSQMLVSFFSTHLAGVYQQVSVTPGADLRFSAFGKGWTSTSDFPLNTSIGGTDLRMRIGIDPFGGTDALSSNVLWSGESNAADSFVHFTFETRALANTVTVFLYSSPFDARRHNNVFWDDAELVVLSGDAAATAQAGYPTPTPTPVTPTATPETIPVGQSLLRNASFEQGFYVPCSWSADPVPWNHIPCEPWYEKIMRRWNTVQTPTDWVAWWREPYTDTAKLDYFEYPNSCNRPKAPEDCVPWHNPEYGGTDWIRNGPPRIRTGENSLRYFTFWSVHEAGVFQTVEGIPPGTTLRFSIYMHAWSATEAANGDEPSPFESGGQSNMHMRVGIDPTGGRNPWSSDVIWSAERSTYDEFGYYQITAVARANRVTVFTYSRPEDDTKHNDIYADDAELIVVSIAGLDSAAAPAPTPQPAAAQPSSNPGTGFANSSSSNVPTTPIPDGSVVHTVGEGDTISVISFLYDVRLQRILELNNLQLDSILSIGQQLVIWPPGAVQQPASEPPANEETPASAPAGDASTEPSENVAEPESAAGELGSLCVRAFTDANSDGLFTAGENLVAGIDLILLNVEDAIVATYRTDGLSEPYCFKEPVGTYTLQVQTPAGRTPTSHTQWKIALAANSQIDVELGSVKDTDQVGSVPLSTAPDDENAGRLLGGLLGLVLIVVALGLVFWFARARRGI